MAAVAGSAGRVWRRERGELALDSRRAFAFASLRLTASRDAYMNPC
jgi:hypothetical protein